MVIVKMKKLKVIMKICILICGLRRCIDLVMNEIESLFIGNNIGNNISIDFIICLDNNNDEKNNLIYNEVFSKKNIIKKLFINDIHDNSYRNSYMSSLNASAKSMANPKPIIHNRTPVYSNPSQLNAINKNASAYQKALKSQSINYSRNTSAFQNSLTFF